MFSSNVRLECSKCGDLMQVLDESVEQKKSGKYKRKHCETNTKIVSTCLTLGMGFSDQVMVARILGMCPLTYFTFSKYEKYLGEKILEVQEETLEKNRQMESSLSPTVERRSAIAASFDIG